MMIAGPCAALSSLMAAALAAHPSNGATRRLPLFAWILLKGIGKRATMGPQASHIRVARRDPVARR